MVALVRGGAIVARVKRNDEPVKVDAEILRKARILTSIRNTTLAEYISSVLAPIVERDYQEALKSETAPKKRK